jgi:hypothetical protein
MKLIGHNRTTIIEEEYKVQKDNTTYTIWMKLNSDGHIQDYNVSNEEGYVVNQHEILDEFLDTSDLEYLY